MNVALMMNGFNWSKIGDSLTLSSLPENLFRSKGHRIVDVHRHWTMDFNPYVLRDVEPDMVYDLGRANLDILTRYGENLMSSFANIHQQYTIALGADVHLGRGRLYRYEDATIQPHTLCVHTTPHDIQAGRAPFSDAIIDCIRSRYTGWRIVQVGGETDRVFEGAEDKRGTSMWEMTEIIAASEVFIGPSSGPLHIADCYPRVKKKLIMFAPRPDAFVRFRPRWLGFPGADWINWGWEYFNNHEVDIGATRSYKWI